jgi:hypothetical protein
MYWNPMSSWPEWLTTSLAIVSWALAACLVFYSVREAFRSSTPDGEDRALESPQDHELARAKAERVVSGAGAGDD